MWNRLRHQAHEALAARRQRYEQIRTPEQIADWQKRLRTQLLAGLGEMPEKTPLNARIVATVPRDGYREQKIIFESRPGLPVTGVLYLPDAEPPYPAALVPCGHSNNGKAYENYQQAPILLARHGIAGFCFDPIGQGERSQILDKRGCRVVGSTVEHTLIGAGSILLGRSIAGDMIHDAIRAVDYLVSRNDIDAARIGCTGTSGGGTQTSYLMAIDPRIACAVPCCYLTSLGRLIDTIGPQDAEQNLHAQVRCGLDHADYAILFAPRPLLLGAATRDFFDIEGTWETFRQVKRIYTRLGFAERVEIVEADLPHNFDTELRVPMVRWMRRWLCGVDEPVGEPPAELRTDEQMHCTPKGQVLRIEGAKSLFDLNADLEARLAAKRKQFWKENSREVVLGKVREIAGIRPLAGIPEPAAELRQIKRAEGFTVSDVWLQPEPDVALSGILLRPEVSPIGACLYLPDDASEASAAEAGATADGPAADLARRGYLVLALPLPGLSGTKSEEIPPSTRHFGHHAKEFFLAYLLGRPYLGIRAEQILMAARWLRSQAAEDAPPALDLVAVRETTAAALHAAALEPDLFRSLQLESPGLAWSDIVHAPLHRNELINTVHGALQVYDLPDLVANLPAGMLKHAQGPT